MIPDSSAWIEYFRETGSAVHRRLAQAIAGREPIAVTEVVLAEVLAGATEARTRGVLRQTLLNFGVLRLEGLADYEQAAALYRACQAGGDTLRSIADCLIAVPAIRAGMPVLHSDADFDKLARHTALEVVEV